MTEQQTLQRPVRTVDLTKNSNLLIQQAHKKADNLITKILVDTIWAKTFGKAYLIDQKNISTEYTMSTILQETEDGQMIALETVHPANEDISKQFERKRRTTKDFGIVMYPMYLAMIMLTILYSVLIYRAGIKKLPIIVESSQWMDILLITLLFILVEGFIYYWIANQYIGVTTFRSYSRPMTKTYEVRFDGKLKSITAVKFHGMFFTVGTTTSKKLFGHSPGEIEEYLTNADGESYVKLLTIKYNEKIIIEQQIVDAYRLYEIKLYEFESVEASHMRELSNRDVSELDDLKNNKDDEILKEKKEDLKSTKEYFKKLEAELMPDHKILVEELAKLEGNYLGAINTLMGDAKESKARELLVNSDKLISTLTHENSLLKARTIRLTNMLQGAYEEGLVRSDQVREDVYSLIQEEGTNKYQINYTIAAQNGQERVVSSGDQPQAEQRKGGISLDMTPLLKILIGVAAIIAIIYSMGWLFTTIIAAFGGLTPLAVFGMFVFLLLLVISGMYIFRGLSKYDSMMSNSDSSIKLN